jgi:hypothetical protein
VARSPVGQDQCPLVFLDGTLSQAYMHASDAPQRDAHNYLQFVRAIIKIHVDHHYMEETFTFLYLEKSNIPMDVAAEQHKVFHDALVTLAPTSTASSKRQTRMIRWL